MTAASIEADMSALTTNNSRRDGPARQQAQLTGSTIVVVGSLDVVFSDFGITAPTAPIVLSVDDHGQIELQLFFSRA